MNERKLRRVLSTDRRRRALRERPTPKWLTSAKDLDEMAKRRCLMILSVLSGTRPVSEVIEEAKISRGTYYQLETKAIQAMLQTLLPGVEASGGGENLTNQMKRLEQKIARLEREKRRAERLAYLTRQVIRPGPVSTGGKGPRPRKRKASMKPGGEPLPGSPRAPESSRGPSIPTTAGAGAPSHGTAS